MILDAEFHSISSKNIQDIASLRRRSQVVEELKENSSIKVEK